MGNVIPVPAGGGGADLDAVTATEHDVLEGKVIVDTDGNPVTGTMPDNPAISVTLSAGESTQIPEGHVPGGTVAARDLASQTPGNASAGSILQDESAWVNGQQIVGNIQSMGGQSVTPQTYQQVVSCAGKRMTDNIVVAGAALPPADAIKKGYQFWIGGNSVIGTFEGYIPTPNDLYYMGNNPAGFHSVYWIVYYLDHIEIPDVNAFKYIMGTNAFDFTGHAYLKIDGEFCNGAVKPRGIRAHYGDPDLLLGAYTLPGSSCSGRTTAAIPIPASLGPQTLFFEIDISFTGNIYRIWLE